MSRPRRSGSQKRYRNEVAATRLKVYAVSALGFFPLAWLLSLWADLDVWQALALGVALGFWLAVDRIAERRWAP